MPEFTPEVVTGIVAIVLAIALGAALYVHTAVTAQRRKAASRGNDQDYLRQLGI